MQVGLVKTTHIVQLTFEQSKIQHSALLQPYATFNTLCHACTHSLIVVQVNIKSLHVTCSLGIIVRL